MIAANIFTSAVDKQHKDMRISYINVKVLGRQCFLCLY